MRTKIVQSVLGSCMFMLKEEIDKSVTQLLRPDPKLLKPKLTPPQRTHALVDAG
jgi:hypothetical protein